MTGRAATLCEELLALTRRFRAEVEAGDESGSVAFAERRTALVAAIIASGEPPDPEAVRALLACDRELVALLGDRQREVWRALAAVATGRLTLTSYRDTSPTTPAYIERLS